MLGLAKRTGASMLQASTSEIYGDPEIHPQTEDYWGNVNPIGSLFKACTIKLDTTLPSLISIIGPYVLNILAIFISTLYCLL